ncbi:MAG: NADPH-dependent 7-cyano-7-deazaguanine reductase QueF [Fimbriimonadaceae bacterium]|nr:NADPH-dependent 7-cyano-7-deazaguanine reductase QueF [Fimbriimonadaceae bacterium]
MGVVWAFATPSYSQQYPATPSNLPATLSHTRLKCAVLETFPNPAPQRDYTITHIFPEFTSVCPKTGHPDFAEITLEYIPDQLCIELKALKLYYNSFRDKGIFYEAVTNQLLDELAACCSPRWMRVTAEFNVRGGIGSVIVAETGQSQTEA